MLKVLMGTMVFSMLSMSAYAENCHVSNALELKKCSIEYYKAKNQKDLNDYLLNGKFKEGKLLNLLIDFNIKEKVINIATSCDLKLSKEKNLNATLDGICLKGSSVYLEGGNSLFADKKAPININAFNSVTLRRSLIETKGNISVSTENFLPMEGEILISRESHLSAEKIHVFSKSNLIINSESKVNANRIILDGGNCEINEKNDRDDNDERVHDREWRRFKPQFSYSGTCLSNPLSTDFKITSTANSTNSQSVNFGISGTSSISTVNWKVDESFKSIGPITQHDFIFPGKHLVQAVAIGSNGYFRKIGKYINISPVKLNKAQIAIFQFFGSKNAPRQIQALIDMKTVTLTKLDQNPELYSFNVDTDKTRDSSVIVPYFKYHGQFPLVVLPLISNPVLYVNQKINELDTAIDTLNSNNPQFISFKQSLGSILGELKIKITTLDSRDQMKLANFLQANLFADLVFKSTGQFSKPPSTLMGMFLSNAYAQANEDALEEQITRDSQAAVLSMSKLLGAGFVAIGVIIGSNKSPWSYVAGLISITTGVYLLTSVANSAQDSLNNVHIPNPNTFNLKIPNKIQSNKLASMTLQGQYVPVESIPSSSLIINQSVVSMNNFNSQLGEINTQIIEMNSLLSLIGINTNVEPMPLLYFPQTTLNGVLSSIFIASVKIISSDNGDASVKSFSSVGNSLQVLFQSNTTQSAKLRVSYVNPALGITQDIETLITIYVEPKAVINYTKNNLQVNFDSSSSTGAEELTYKWNFGDSQTSSLKKVSHNYLLAGTYDVSLTVTDSNGVSDTAKIQVEVNSGLIQVKIDPTQTFFEMVSNPYGDIYRPAPPIAIPLDKNGLGLLEMGAFNTSNSCLGQPGCLQKSMVVAFSDGFNYLYPGPRSTGISTDFYQTPSRYRAPAQAFQISTNPDYPSFVEVPNGARYIFVSPADDYFRDNTDYGYYLYLKSEDLNILN